MNSNLKSSCFCLILFLSATILTINGCTGDDVTTRIESRASISGKVVLSEVPGLNDMSRVRVDAGHGEGGTTPDEDGSFYFEDLEPDVYKLAIIFTGGLTPSADKSAYKKYEVDVIAKQGGSVNLGQIKLELGNGNVSGQVAFSVSEDEVSENVSELRSALTANNDSSNSGESDENSGVSSDYPENNTTNGADTGTGGDSTGAVVRLTSDDNSVKEAEINKDGTFEFDEVPIGYYRMSVHREGYAVSAGQGSCLTQVVVGYHTEVIATPSFSMSETAVSLLPGHDQTEYTDGSNWFLKGDGITVNVQAGFAAKGRAWKEGYEENGEDKPKYEMFMESGYPFAELNEGITKVYLQFMDLCGYESDVYSLKLIRDITAPDVAFAKLNDGAMYTTEKTVSLSVGASDDFSDKMEMRTSLCVINGDGATTCEQEIEEAPWEDYQYSQSITFDDAEGEKKVQVQLRDLSKNETEVFSHRITYDSVKPQNMAVTIADGMAVVKTNTVSVKITGEGATWMKVGTESGLAGASWQSFSPSFYHTFSIGDGDKHLYIQFKDNAGNITDEIHAQFTLDQTAPVISKVILEDGSNYSISNTVALLVESPDDVRDTYQVEITGDISTGSGVYSYSEIPSELTLLSGEGLYTINVVMTDMALNKSEVIFAHIRVDLEDPINSIPIVGDNSGYITNADGITSINILCDDGFSGIDTESYKLNGGEWQTETALAASYVIDLGDTEGEFQIETKCTDKAGRESNVKSVTVLFDSTAPQLNTPSISINNGDAVTSSQVVSVSFNVIGADEYIISGDPGLADGTYRSFVNKTSFFLPNIEGNHTIYARFQDKAGNETSIVSADIKLSYSGSVKGVVLLEGQTDHSSILVSIDGSSLQASTDAAGNFTIENVSIGAHSLNAIKSGFVDDNIPMFNISVGETLILNEITLTRRRGEIAGRVLLQGLSDHSGVLVSIIDTNYSTKTNAEGDFSFKLPVGNYNGITILKSNYKNYEDKNTITVAEEGTANLSTISLVQLKNSLSGKVTLFNNNVHTGIAASMSCDSGNIVKQTITDSNGIFSFDTLPISSCILSLSYKEGWETLSTEVIIAAGLPQTILPFELRERYIVINDYAEASTSRSVTLTLGASDALTMKVSELPDFSNTIDVNFDTSITFNITSTDDGIKRIYAQFIDTSGSPSQSVYDDIILDTTVKILAVTENAGGIEKNRGQTITFTLNAGEINGTAAIDIAGYTSGIKLFDDGKSGDIDINDGIYGVIYEITEPNDVSNATVTGQFTDKYGNIADPFDTNSTISIQVKPEISNIKVIPYPQNGTAVVTWTTDELTTASVDWGEDNTYSGGNSLDDNYELEHSLTMTSLVPSKQYHYRIRSTDAAGNEQIAIDRTFWVQPSEPGNVVSLGGDGRIDIIWEAPPQTNIKGYYVLASNTQGGPYTKLNSNSPVIPRYLLYSDTGLENRIKKYYVVRSIDEFDNESINSAEVTTQTVANNGGTEAGGVYPDKHVFSSSGSPYTLTTNILVEEGKSFYIAPGTIINTEGNVIYVEGLLKTTGTVDSKIEFITSSDSVSNEVIEVRENALSASFDENNNYISGPVLGHFIMKSNTKEMVGRINTDKVLLYLYYPVVGSINAFFRVLDKIDKFIILGGSIDLLSTNSTGVNFYLNNLYINRIGGGLFSSNLYISNSVLLLKVTRAFWIDKTEINNCNIYISAPNDAFVWSSMNFSITNSYISIDNNVSHIYSPGMGYNEIFSGNYFSGLNPDNEYFVIDSANDTINASENYWGDEITVEMNEKGDNSNISVFYDYYDDPIKGKINYSNWLLEPPDKIGPYDFDLDGYPGANHGGTDCDDEDKDAFPGAFGTAASGEPNDCTQR